MHPEVLEGYDDAALRATSFEALARVVPAFVSCIDRRRRILYLNRTLSRGQRTLEELQRSAELRRRVVEHLPDFVYKP